MIDDQEILQTGNLKLYARTCTATRKGHVVRLGGMECQMLAMLMHAKGAPVATEEICGALWGSSDGLMAQARVRGVARRLRSKLHGVRIETIVREGYSAGRVLSRSA